MEYNYPTDQDPSKQQQANPPQQQQQSGSSRGRGRRAYAAQQYDFNAPVAGSMYTQQPPQTYPPPAYSQAAPAVGPVQSQAGQPQGYGHPQAYPPPGYQYGQDYKAPDPNMYQQPYPGQTDVAGVTNQMQHLHVSQVD